MRYAAFIFFILSSPAYAAACNSAIKPEPQTQLAFYSNDTYGRLGIRHGQFLWILDQYRCYDLSFLDSTPFLSIYFNNAWDGDNNEPTYVGAIIVRVFRSGDYQEGPFSAYLYRNTTRRSRTTSKWAHGNAEQGTTASPADLKVLNDELDSEDPIRASNFAELDRLLRLGEKATEARLKEWHSLLIRAQDNGYFVYRDTLKSNTHWTLDSKLKDATGSYLIARSYLIKYQTSSNPQPEVFFQVGAAAADCVYIRLVAPGDSASNFAITGRGRFISLKMRSDATCVSPD